MGEGQRYQTRERERVPRNWESAQVRKKGRPQEKDRKRDRAQGREKEGGREPNRESKREREPKRERVCCKCALISTHPLLISVTPLCLSLPPPPCSQPSLPPQSERSREIGWREDDQLWTVNPLSAGDIWLVAEDKAELQQPYSYPFIHNKPQGGGRERERESLYT